MLLWSVPGREPALPSVLLNAHMDVVPCERAHWRVEPFAGVCENDGMRLVARGTQDMKSAGCGAALCRVSKFSDGVCRFEIL